MSSSQWVSAFDGLIGFRRFLEIRLACRMRAEVKANHLLHNKGDFLSLALSEHARYFIYKGLLQLQPKLGLLHSPSLSTSGNSMAVRIRLKSRGRSYFNAWSG